MIQRVGKKSESGRPLALIATRIILLPRSFFFGAIYCLRHRNKSNGKKNNDKRKKVIEKK